MATRRARRRRATTTTPEKALGLHVRVCRSCGAFTSSPVGTCRPTRCANCGSERLS